MDNRRNDVCAGENNGRSKLTNQQTVEIYVRRMGGETCVSLAKEFGVSFSRVSQIGLGR